MSKKDTSIIDFVLGCILTIIGLYKILKNTSVGFWSGNFLGTNLSGGVVTIPIIIGIVLIFLKHQSKIGYILVAVGIVLLIVHIMLSVHIRFYSTSLLNYVIMIGATLAGVILLGRALLRLR